MKIDEDFYFEESNPKKVVIYCLLILVGLVIAGIAFFNFREDTLTRVLDVTIELGEPVPTDIAVFMRGPDIRLFTLDTSNVRVDEEGNTDSVGEYSFRVSHQGRTLRGRIIVVDTTPPTVETFDLIIGEGETFTAEDFISSCFDLSGACFAEFARESYRDLNSRLGNHTLSIVVSDQFENSVTIRVNLTVDADASLSNLRAADLEVDRLLPADSNWDNTFTFRFTRGKFENSNELDDFFLAIANENFNERFEGRTISDTTTIAIYNQHNFIIGLVVRVDFTDGPSIYIDNITLPEYERD